jgi:hypothetical protein
MDPISVEEFDRVVAALRWSDRSLRVTRSLVVDGRSYAEVAEANEMSQQQARVLHTRFLNKLRATRAVKVSAEEYIAQLPATLDLFTPDLLKLRRSGLSDKQLLDFLTQNEIKATVAQLHATLGEEPPRKREKPYENGNARKPKGRRR